MCKDKYVLAMYDVRGKQDYIFRSNKLKEIVGGSLVIRDIYKDYLIDEHDFGVYDTDVDRVEDVPEFKWEEFVDAMEQGKAGQIVYDGGGNFMVLFRDRNTFEKITHDFTRRVLEKTASLRVVATCIEVENGDDFKADRKKLYDKHRVTENTIQNVPLCASLPVSLVSTVSSLPIVYRGKDYTKEEIELTSEQKTKYEKYKDICIGKDGKALYGEQVLDKIAPEKGADSHIAVIYIDGNSMGAKVQECVDGLKTYDECITALRRFSWKIQHECIDTKMQAIDSALKEKYGEDGTCVKRRLVLGAGDEINVIVAGRDAYDVACAYLNDLGKHPEAAIGNEKFSSCAGVSVFKSHMPYAEAYRIAEECCESGKNRMKELGLKNTSFLDFHMCQGAIDVSLEQIRRDEETENNSRPWLIVDADNECDGMDEIITTDEINNMSEFLSKIAHGNTKGLLAASRDGEMSLEMELRRIKAHQAKDERNNMDSNWKFVEKLQGQKRCKLIYDMVLMYDMWFRSREDITR